MYASVSGPTLYEKIVAFRKGSGSAICPASIAVRIPALVLVNWLESVIHNIDRVQWEVNSVPLSLNSLKAATKAASKFVPPMGTLMPKSMAARYATTLADVP